MQHEAAQGPAGEAAATAEEVAAGSGQQHEPQHPGAAADEQPPAGMPQQAVLQPQALRVLVVDAKSSSRSGVCSLLRDCEYQVHAVKTSAEALAYLVGQHNGSSQGLLGDPPGVDLILKDHEPPASDAGRLLLKMAASELLRRTPVVVMSSQDERETVMNCLTLGAIDYLVKPLRHNELRHIWTRVWWWRRSGLAAPLPWDAPAMLPNRPLDLFGRSYQSSDQETKCDDEEEPTSKEGSAPDGNGNGSNGNGSNGNGHGSNGSKNGNGTSRVEAKLHDTGNGNGNGSSDNKNGHHGSNGNGASTTLAAERNGAHMLAHTAEGRAPAGLVAQEGPALPKVATGRSLAFPGDPYSVLPTSSSRKRPFAQVGEAADTPKTGTAREGAAHQQLGPGEPPAKVKSVAAHRERDRGERHEWGEWGNAERGDRVAAAAERAAQAAAAHDAACRAAGGVLPMPSLDTQQPSQRAQLVNASGSGGGRMEGVGSASGEAHGSGSGRTANGASGADGANTVSAAHFMPHHLQASGQASLTHGANHLVSWGSLHRQPAGGPRGPTNPTHSQSNSFPPPMYPGAFGLPPHLLAQPLHALSMFAGPSPSLSGPTPDLHATGLNPLAMQQMLALQLGAPLPPGLPAPGVGPEDRHASIEGCSSAGGSQHAKRLSANDTSGSMTGFPHPMLMQYLQALSQLNASNQLGANLGMLSGGAVQAHMMQGPLVPAAQAAMAAAWAATTNSAAGLMGPMHGGPPGSVFPPPGSHLPPRSAAAHPLPSMASGNAHPAAMQLAALQHPLLANPALSMAAAAAVMPGPGPGPQQGAPGVLQGPARPSATPPPGSVQGSGSARADTTAAAGPRSGATAPDASNGVRAGGIAGDPASHQALMMLGGISGMMLNVQPSLLGPAPSLQLSGLGGSKGTPVAGPQQLQQGPMQPQPQLGLQALGVGPEAGSTRRRRALALDKYRMKRKNLKFGSAIRYETRKAQAQARPRIKGQFAKASAAAPTKAHSAAGTGVQGSTAGGGEAGPAGEEGDEARPAARGVPGEEEDEEYDHGADADDNDMEEEEEEGDRQEVQAASNTPQRAQSASPAVDSGTAAARWPARYRTARAARGMATGKSRLAQQQQQAGVQAAPAQLQGPEVDAPVVEPAGRLQDVVMQDAQQGGAAGGPEGGLCEEEEDVVDSLRELKEGHRVQGLAGSSKQHSGHHHHHHRQAAAGEAAAHPHTHPALGLAAAAQPLGGAAAAVSGFSDGQGAAAHGVAAAAHVGAAGAGPQASLSMGSQSGLAASKGSQGRTSQHQRGAASTRPASCVGALMAGSQGERDAGHGTRGDSSIGGAAGAAAAREGRGDTRDLDAAPPSGSGQRGSSHGRDAQARGAGLTERTSAHPNAHGSNANTGKNGSDSGSNSPDENGNGGSGGSAGNEGVDQAAHGSGSGSHGHLHAQPQHPHPGSGHRAERHEGHR